LYVVINIGKGVTIERAAGSRPIAGSMVEEMGGERGDIARRKKSV
jgi:hypothetical protein